MTEYQGLPSARSPSMVVSVITPTKYRAGSTEGPTDQTEMQGNRSKNSSAGQAGSHYLWTRRKEIMYVNVRSLTETRETWWTRPYLHAYGFRATLGALYYTRDC